MANKGMYLLSGQSLAPGDYLSSSDSRYCATLRPDGNFVIYWGWWENRIGAMWESGTAGDGGTPLLTMQDDGNLVLTRDGRTVWATASPHGRGDYFATMQADGNFVLYQGTPSRKGADYWETATYESWVWVRNNAAYVAAAKVLYNGTTVNTERFPVGQCRQLRWPAARNSTLVLSAINALNLEVTALTRPLGAQRSQRFEMLGSLFNPHAAPVPGHGYF